jgi:hypothetical protein
MSKIEPIDVDMFDDVKFEEDLYGEQPSVKAENESSPEPDPEWEKLKFHKKKNSTPRRPSQGYRRADRENEDRSLVEMIDSGYAGWQ